MNPRRVAAALFDRSGFIRNRGRASAAPATSSDSKGTRAPSRHPKLLALASAAVLASLILGVTLAAAATPAVTIAAPTEVAYTTVHVSGTIDPEASGASIYVYFEYREPSAGGWGATYAGEISAAEATGSAPIPVQAGLSGLAPGTEYEVRLDAYSEGLETYSPAPNPTITTEAVAKPTVSIEPIAPLSAGIVHLSGHVNPNAPAGPLSPAAEEAFRTAWHFRCEPECQGLEQGTIAADNSSHEVASEATLPPGHTYSITLVAANAGGSEEAGPETLAAPAIAPAISATFASATATAANLSAQVNPGGAPTSYRFEYVTDAQFAAAEFTAASSTPNTSLGSGNADRPAYAQLSGLSPQTTYHYRLLAESPVQTVLGPAQTFTTAALPVNQPENCPNAALRTGASVNLPDCRAYEQVSPLDKHGNAAGVDIAAAFPAPRPQYAIARADGEAIMFGTTREVINGALGEAESGINFYWTSHRSPLGWTTHAALPPGDKLRHNELGNSLFLDIPQPILPSANLAEFAFVAGDTFGVPREGEIPTTFLAKSDGGVDWIAQPIVAEPQGPLFESAGGPGQNISGASPDLSTLYFTYPGTLVPEDELHDPAVGGISRAEVIAAESSRDVGFYEWHQGSLKSAAVLPDGNVDPYGAVPAATLGHNGLGSLPSEYADNQVSNEGNNALFVSPDPNASAPVSDPPELYLREHVSGGETRTVLVSKSTLTGLPASPGPIKIAYPEPRESGGTGSYAYSSPDGSRVYFEDVAQLTSTAPADESLKAYEFNSVTGELRYLPDVANGSENGAPVLVSSADGSSFMFERRLPSGAELDLWNGHAISLIAPLPAPDTAFVIAPTRADRNGTAYVFETTSPIAGFNDAGSFEQIYRYDATSEELTCLSCPPQGTAPSGDAHLSNDVEQASVLDSRGVANEATRVFFDTPDPLTPRDSNGKRDVYEWQGGQVHLISSGTGPHDSFLLDNDETGANVFFATADPLSAQDEDGNYDVYDAREGGGFAPSAPPPTCHGEGCQGPLAATPSPPTPSSSSFIGPGNPKAKHHRKHHHKKHKKQRRRAANKNRGNIR